LILSAHETRVKIEDIYKTRWHHMGVEASIYENSWSVKQQPSEHGWEENTIESERECTWQGGRFPHNPNMVDEGRGTDPDRKHLYDL